MDGATSLLHATCLARGARAVLLLGPSGAGKSDLALRCLLTGWPAATDSGAVKLVADDQVLIERLGDRLLARAPEAIRGRLEVRGLGILEFPNAPEAEVRLVVRLAAPADIERLPDPGLRTTLLGLDLPLLAIAPFEASAALKLLLALDRQTG